MTDSGLDQRRYSTATCRSRAASFPFRGVGAGWLPRPDLHGEADMGGGPELGKVGMPSETRQRKAVSCGQLDGYTSSAILHGGEMVNPVKSRMTTR